MRQQDEQTMNGTGTTCSSVCRRGVVRKTGSLDAFEYILKHIRECIWEYIRVAGKLLPRLVGENVMVDGNSTTKITYEWHMKRN